MKRRILALTGGLLAIAVTASAFAADLTNPAPGSSSQQPQQATADIVDTAIAAGDFTTLVAAVQAAGLEETLRGAGPFTVFAPTDDAFAALPEGTVEALLGDIPALTDILLYHVVAGAVPADTVVGLSTATTVQGSDVTIEVVEGNVILNGEVMVIATDIEASNGIIHVIDAVLLPPAAEEGFTVAPAASGLTLTGYTGSLQSLAAAGSALGLASAAATVDGSFVIHVFGAPDFVNADFNASFADGFSSTPLIVRAR
jgi:transforming growth factor-beta-induced protein